MIGIRPHRPGPQVAPGSPPKSLRPPGPSGTRPAGDLIQVSGESSQAAPAPLLAGLVSNFAQGLRPPAPNSKAPVVAAPKLEAITGKMQAVRRGETRNSFGPAEWLQVKQLEDFAKRAPTASTDPRGVHHSEAPPRTDSSIFATRVREQQKRLGDWIIRQPERAQLDPADVYEQSLAINKGDAFNAQLTAHNLMKDVTASARGAKSSTPEIRRRDAQIEARLQSLREDNDPQRADKMGPWYHLFGIGLASAAANGSPLRGLVNGGQMAMENVPRTGTDPGKTASDAWAARVFK